MDIEQVKKVVRAVQAACPAQIIDAHTAGVWHFPLADVDFAMAMRAVGELSKTRRFIAPADIVEWVKMQRRDRIEHSVIPAPPVDPDKAEEYKQAIAAYVKTVGNGGAHAGVQALAAAEPVPAVESEIFREIRREADTVQHDEEFLVKREHAETKPCRQCGAVVGQTCIGPEGKPVQMQPAHWVRLEDVGLVEAVPERTREEQAAALDARIAAEGL